MSKIKNNINNCTTIFILYNYSDLPFQNNCNEIYSFFIKYIVSFFCVSGKVILKAKDTQSPERMLDFAISHSTLIHLSEINFI